MSPSGEFSSIPSEDVELRITFDADIDAEEAPVDNASVFISAVAKPLEEYNMLKTSQSSELALFEFDVILLSVFVIYFGLSIYYLKELLFPVLQIHL